MPKIRLLSPDLIAKIAAGEVIERPASVVKELLENSLDAGAKSIKIDIEKGGLQKISLFDDGAGMEKEDLEVCHKPHTTSKLETDEELSRIMSLGFRGEALSSIAAVSEMIIRSKTALSPIGHQTKILNRKIVEKNPVGMPSGTQIIIENLFENTPARKKFFSSETLEFQHILNLVTKIALSFPKVGFDLSHNKKSVLSLPKNQTPDERIRRLLGDKIFSFLLPLSFESPHLKLHGFLGKPQIAARSKNKQYLFINQRLVRNLPVSLAIKEAFGSLLDPKSHPVFFLDLRIAPENLDVNVHPRKEEIKFLSSKAVTKEICAAVRETLEKNNLLFSHYSPDSFEENSPHTAMLLREQTPIWNVRENLEEKEILQLHNTYLIIETKTGALLVDQHAAHERILYEQFLKTFQEMNAKKHRYEFPEAIVFSLPLSETKHLENHLETFSELGFDIEPFGHDTFKVSAVPEIFKERNIFSLIREVLGDLMEEKNISIDRYSEKTISYLACRSAIKAGDYLTPEERKRLVEKLGQTQSGYTCPHGRPAQIEISKTELEKMFRRR